MFFNCQNFTTFLEVSGCSYWALALDMAMVCLKNTHIPSKKFQKLELAALQIIAQKSHDLNEKMICKYCQK
jgi:hypothetical protein